MASGSMRNNSIEPVISCNLEGRVFIMTRPVTMYCDLLVSTKNSGDVCKLLKYRVLEQKIDGDDLNWTHFCNPKANQSFDEHRKIYLAQLP